MEPAIYINDRVEIPGWELWFTASLSGGPGGQHVNKVNSRVTLHWQITDSGAVTAGQKELIGRKLKNRISGQGILQITVDDHRSQHRNRETARERLAQLIRESLAEAKRRVPTRVSLMARRRRLTDKRRRSLAKSLRKSPSSSDY